MKKYTLIAALVAASATGFAQVKFGPQVTGGIASASIKEDPEVDFKKKSQASFGLGVIAEVPLSSRFSLRPSLSLLKKGVSLKGSSPDDGTIGSAEVKITNDLYYAELPVIATWNQPLGNGKLFIGAGPSLGVGLFGKSKASYRIQFPGLPAMEDTEKLDAFKGGEEGAGMKRLDISANAIAGYQWNNGLYMNAGYLHGFSNLEKNPEAGSGYRNRSFHLSVGFLLGGK